MFYILLCSLNHKLEIFTLTMCWEK
jgi:hypothetical protein